MTARQIEVAYAVGLLVAGAAGPPTLLWALGAPEPLTKSIALGLAMLAVVAALVLRERVRRGRRPEVQGETA